MARLNMVQAINLALGQEMARDDRVMVLGEDVGRDGGVFRVTEGLLDRFGAGRVIDTPLSESAIVGAAIGMAAYGLLPVAEIQFMGFAYAALDQLFTHGARLRTRSRGRYSCPLVVRTPYGGGIKAPEMHEESSEALFCHMPGIKVVVPSGPGGPAGERGDGHCLGEHAGARAAGGGGVRCRGSRHHRGAGDDAPAGAACAGCDAGCAGAAGGVDRPLPAGRGADTGGPGRGDEVLGFLSDLPDQPDRSDRSDKFAKGVFHAL